MRWIHWFVILASVALTISAWEISDDQMREKALIRFERETTNVINLVLKRMQRYEDALWAGAAFINTVGGDVEHETWRSYAERIRIEQKYPGINGIGVIHHVPRELLDPYLEDQRLQRPSYSILSQHDHDVLWPISYIVPLSGNELAEGFDIANERNRRTGARLARDTGLAQITGPIFLVQDEQQTPGFLFYAPFYRTGEIPSDIDARRESITGLVYAPFVVRKLMQGVLARSQRNVDFTLSDGDTVLYDENVPGHGEFDPDPLFQARIPLQLYGRTWTFDFRSTLGFRRDASSLQPTTILVGGIIVDFMLLLLLMQIAKSNRQTRQHARSLRRAQDRLAEANDELSQFNYRTSHDLVAPLKTIQGFADLARRDIRRGNYESLDHLLSRINEQAVRLDQLVQDLLKLGRVDWIETEASDIDANRFLQDLEQAYRDLAREQGVAIRCRSSLSQPFRSQEVRLRQILENLLSNGIKYADSDKAERWVELRISAPRPDRVRIEIEDNGVGIPSHVGDRIYEMFFRVGNTRQYGSGLGIYLVKKHLAHLKGSIHYESSAAGTLFTVEIPNESA